MSDSVGRDVVAQHAGHGEGDGGVCHVTITGVVQGVGFRPFVYNLATRMGLAGWVLNHSGGVDLEVEGQVSDIDAFVAALETEAPPLARIASVNVQRLPPQGYDTFEIRHSESQAGRYQLISPDVATCADCVRELFDPDDFRYRYPFINCTNCGPRFTIIEDIPYDRPKTTMRVFPMCETCRAEYEDPANRRFHAQPVACPACGPQIWLAEGPATPDAARLPPDVPESDAVLARAKALLLDGKILAIKGLGGFHLACDATNAEAVAELRARKRRPHKPFALMVATMDEVRALCEVSAAEEALLTSPQAPIVLLRALKGGPVADEVAPNSGTLGVMLPYTPLHHLILRDVGRPLVMTSGNMTEEPIAKDNEDALRRLAPLADAFLLHNRDIHARYDDSVVQVIAYEVPPAATTDAVRANEATEPTVFHVQFLRRARSYAPFPIELPFELPQIFAAGPAMKNTFTLTRSTYAFVSQHIGDLENFETLEHYEAALSTYQHLFRLQPEIVACDLHPDYLSTRFATSFAQEHGLPPPYRVQHHRAHIAGCLADHGWAPEAGPVLGVAWDGTGYGEDGHMWGGEWFVGGYHGFERVAHLDYLPLPGGDAAVHHPWRIAVAYLHAMGMDERLPLGEFCPSDVMRIRVMVDRKLNTPLTSSMGRLFDAVSALLGICYDATYEAQAAIELEQVATRWQPSDAEAAYAPAPYPFEVDDTIRPYVVRVAPMFDALLVDMAQGLSVAEIAWRFHLSMAALVTDMAVQLRQATGLNTLAMSGGVFQNRLLLSLALPRLQAAGLEVLLHKTLPPNDGSVSLGQAVMAAFVQDA